MPTFGTATFTLESFQLGGTPAAIALAGER
jgi:hypothetical protein